MYLVTYRVDRSKLKEFLKAAEPHGTMTRCQEETEDFEASQRELNAIGQNVNAILNRYRRCYDMGDVRARVGQPSTFPLTSEWPS